MAAALNATTVAGILKRYFSNKTVQNSIAAKQGAIWKAMPKKTDGGGDFCTFTQVLKDVFTVSQDFTVAQGLAQNSTVSPGLKFNLPWQEINAPIRVSAKAKALTRTNVVAFLNAVAFAAASAMRMAHHMLSVRALASGWGELAASPIVYTPGTDRFTVVNGAVNHFVEGMPLVASDSLHADALRSATAANVDEVDYSTGIVATDVASLSGTLAWADGDFVFLSGDRQNVGGGAAVRVCAVGLRTWLPEVRPVVDTGISTVEGTLRTGNSRAFGMFVDGTGKDDIDAIEDLVTQAVVIGNATDLVMNVSHRRYTAMNTSLGTDRRFQTNEKGDAGFLRLSVSASEITVPIVVDRNCEDDVGYAMQKGAYENVGAGETPHVQMDGGGQWVRVSDDNSSELRIYAVHAFVMHDPAACGVALFAPLA